jgi:CRISPR-associated protein Cmr6
VARGKVKTWNGGTGFIASPDGSSIFFGDKDLRGLLPNQVQMGLEVEYEPATDGKTGKPRARNVRPASAGANAPSVPQGARKISSVASLSPALPPAVTSSFPEVIPHEPLPQSLRNLLGKVTAAERHPGLQLDKLLCPCPDQKKQREVLNDVARIPGSPDLLADLLARRRESLQALGGHTWSRTSGGPLTLHLARASALENAGLCLHPVYGFVHLPGTGLKGMARAYAETVWLAAQGDRVQGWADIEAAFGWAPGSDQVGAGLVKPWKPEGVPDRPEGQSAAAGEVVFHDAWPEAWPRLLVDIVNNHHPLYYRGEDAPGDWDAPNPVYFLAVAPGTAFNFSVAGRRRDVPRRLLDLAREWLDGALSELGCGAKTAAGYGYFPPPEPPPVSPAQTSLAVTLRLATPAFLAGAGQKEADCDLRPATVRGQLRWWWRAAHAGYVDVETLRRLEAAIWGDTGNGGAVRIEVRRAGPVSPQAYDKNAAARKNNLPRPASNKTTQGLWYHSYGMHDGGKQRCYLPEGTRWQVIFHVRDATFVRHDARNQPVEASRRRVPKEVVLEQAQMALWWLCRAGGVGAKSRKGFGNFADPRELAAFEGGKFVSKGKALRDACGLGDAAFNAGQAGGSPTLRQMVDLGRPLDGGAQGYLELRVEAGNVWQAIDAAGTAAQSFAQRYKHQRAKLALGMPRKIGHPASGQFHPGNGVEDRHSSPVHYHVHHDGNGFVLRVAAFPSARLPNLKDSETLLKELLEHLRAQFPPV